MTTSIRSAELTDLLARAHKKGATGFVSVTTKDGVRSVYGTLQILRGQLLSAQFAKATGREALEQIAQLEAPKVSFARSVVNAAQDADIPAITELIGAPAAAAKATKRAAKRASFGIFGRVLLTMLAIALIPTAGFWLANLSITQPQLETAATEALADKAGALDETVSTWLGSSVAFLDAAAAQPTVRSMQTDQQKPVMDALEGTYDVFLASVVGLDGYQTARSDDSALVDENGEKTKFRGDRGYFTQIVNGADTGKQLLIGRTSKKPSLALSRPIRGESGELLGVIASTIKLTNISEDVTDIRVGETGFAMLVGPEGELIAHGEPGTVPDEFSEWINVSDHPALNVPAGSSVVYEEEGVKRIAYTRETIFGWTLVIQQDYAEAFAAVTTSQRMFTLLLVASALLAFGLAYLLARWLARPVQNLTEVAEAISLGKLGVSIEGTGRKDEIGALARAIERLRVSVQVMFNELRSQQRS